MNTERPLERIECESRKANDALRDYYELGMERSLAKLAKKYKEGGIKRSFSLLGRWSGVYKWQERVDAQKRIDDKATDDRRAQRRDSQVGNEIDDSSKMREKALALLALPVVERKVKDEDGNTIIIMPVNGSEMDTARKLLVASSEMARLALNMPTDSKHLDVTSGGDKIVIDIVWSDGNADSESKPTDAA